MVLNFYLLCTSDTRKFYLSPHTVQLEDSIQQQLSSLSLPSLFSISFLYYLYSLSIVSIVLTNFAISQQSQLSQSPLSPYLSVSDVSAGPPKDVRTGVTIRP